MRALISTLTLIPPMSGVSLDGYVHRLPPELRLVSGYLVCLEEVIGEGV